MEASAKGMHPSIVTVYGAAFAQGAVGIAFAATSGILKTEFGVQETTYGALFLPMLGVATIGSLCGPGILERASLRGLYLQGAAVLVLAMVGLGLLPLLPVGTLVPALVAIAVLLGAGLALHGLAINTAAMEIAPQARTAALSALHGTLGLGCALGPAMVAALRARGVWWLAPLILAVGIGLPAFSTWLRTPRVFRARGARSERISWAGLPLRFHLFAVPGFFYGVSESTLVNWAVLYFIGTKGLSLAAGAAALSAFWIAMTAGRFLASFVLRRIPMVPFCAVLFVAMSAAFCAVRFARTETQAIVAYAFAGLSCSAVVPLLIGLFAANSDRPSAQVTAYYTAALLAGIGFASVGVGPIGALVGMNPLFLGSALLPLLGLGSLLLLRPREAARGIEPDAHIAQSNSR